MLVTIVTPSYNQGRYIETTIQSVVTQSHAEIEYIVVDGFSVDSTIEILRKYEAHPRVSKIIVERDKGQADAINRGFRMARGEIVGWINSDDCLVPDIVKRTVEAFETEPNLGITYGDIAYVDHDLKIKGKLDFWTRI
jgi:glycosyltransferase involved in cell wall biosynthesis